MKLKDWADKTGVKYLTAYRWFKAGTLPVKAYQTESGTIIVEDLEIKNNNQITISNSSNDSIPLFLKKTVEFSKNNASVEDFAACILSNFNLSPKSIETTSVINSIIYPDTVDIDNIIGTQSNYLSAECFNTNQNVPIFAHMSGGLNPTVDDIKQGHLLLKKMADELKTTANKPKNRKRK